MVIQYSKELKPYAQELRKHATKEENQLWYNFLRKHPRQFRRQKQFGTYIVDFYCSGAKLIIELDGNQHGEPEAIEYDKNRTEYLNTLGLSVLRIRNQDVNRHFQEVCEYINTYL